MEKIQVSHASPLQQILSYLSFPGYAINKTIPNKKIGEKLS